MAQELGLAEFAEALVRISALLPVSAAADGAQSDRPPIARKLEVRKRRPPSQLAAAAALRRRWRRRWRRQLVKADGSALLRSGNERGPYAHSVSFDAAGAAG